MSDCYIPGADPTVIRLELGRIARLLARLGSPEKKVRFVHVAGTNGKGSTAACISSILTAAGYRTGLYTSPALEDVTERFRLGGVPITREALNAVLERVRNAAAGMTDSPTEFETATAAAFLWFADEGCDIAVLEVGLGGRTDATNVIPSPEVCVLTAMAKDHTRLLGSTMTEIASAKAGIIKPGASAVSYGNDEEANAVFRETCRSCNVPLTEADFSRISDLTPGLTGCRFALEPYGEVVLSLPGVYQAKNALLAVTSCEQLNKRGWCIPEEAIRQGLAQVSWPGRFEPIGRDPLFLLDGSHNPQGLEATLKSLREVLPGVKPVLLIGVMADKDVGTMLSLLLPAAARFVTVTAPNPRAMQAEALAEKISALGGTAEAAASIPEGVRRSAELAGQDGTVLALGTLYFSGDVRRAVNELNHS